MIQCQVCDQKLEIYPGGNTSSPILIVGTKKSTDDPEHTPFTNDAGKVFRAEIARYGYDLWNMHLTYFWSHKPKAKCKDWMGEQIIRLGKDKLAIILVGAEPCKYFTKKTSTNISGLITPSHIFSDDKLIMGCIHPSTVNKRGGVVGELRLAAQRITSELERRKIK